jgi:hypothetical protein
MHASLLPQSRRQAWKRESCTLGDAGHLPREDSTVSLALGPYLENYDLGRLPESVHLQ